jgi:hypothetical protein
MEFILTHLDLSSFNNDKELFEEIAVNDQIAMQVTIVYVNIWEYFTSIKLDEENEKSVNSKCLCVKHLNDHVNHNKFV